MKADRFFYLKNMAIYNCTIDGLDYLDISKQDEGINFSINMYGTHTNTFNSPSIILTEIQIIEIINQLQNLIKK